MNSHLRPPSNPLGKAEPPPPNSADRVRDAQELIQWLEPLCEDANFQRFLAWVRAGVKSNSDMALNVAMTPEVRNNHAQRHHALLTVATYPEGQRDAARLIIQASKAK